MVSRAKKPEPKPDRIDYDDDGLDDVVIHDVETFRLERISNGCFWIRCYKKNKPDIVIWLNSKRKITGRHEDD